MKRSVERKKDKQLLEAAFALLEAPRPARYEAWLDRFFGQLGDGQDPWDMNLNWDFPAPASELADLYRATFAYAGEDLAPFGDWQASTGLCALLMGDLSNVCHDLFGDGISEEQRLALCLSLRRLYLDCLAKRSAPVLGHLSEGSGDRKFGYLTYMLWDVSPLDRLISTKLPGREVSALVDTLGQVLLEPGLNPACAESILHGFGHMVHPHPKYRGQIIAAIDTYLSTRPLSRPELYQYAQAAKAGCVQ